MLAGVVLGAEMTDNCVSARLRLPRILRRRP
jgi:hypothetical protein